MVISCSLLVAPRAVVIECVKCRVPAADLDDARGAWVLAGGGAAALALDKVDHGDSPCLGSSVVIDHLVHLGGARGDHLVHRGLGEYVALAGGLGGLHHRGKVLGGNHAAEAGISDLLDLAIRAADGEDDTAGDFDLVAHAALLFAGPHRAAHDSNIDLCPHVHKLFIAGENPYHALAVSVLRLIHAQTKDRPCLYLSTSGQQALMADWSADGSASRECAAGPLASARAVQGRQSAWYRPL